MIRVRNIIINIQTFTRQRVNISIWSNWWTEYDDKRGLVILIWIYVCNSISLPEHLPLRGKLVNTLWSSYAIWRHKSGSKLAPVMACCLTAQTITRTNVDLSSVKASDNHLRVICQRWLIHESLKLDWQLFIRSFILIFHRQISWYRNSWYIFTNSVYD